MTNFINFRLLLTFIRTSCRTLTGLLLYSVPRQAKVRNPYFVTYLSTEVLFSPPYTHLAFDDGTPTLHMLK